MTILYALFALVYLMSVVGSYKTIKNEQSVKESLQRLEKLNSNEKVFAKLILILLSVLWPIITLINLVHECFVKEK